MVTDFGGYPAHRGVRRWPRMSDRNQCWYLASWNPKVTHPGCSSLMDANIVTALAVVVSLYCVSFIWTKVANHRRVRVIHSLAQSHGLNICLPQLSAIPAVGPSGILTSYIGALRFIKNGKEMVQKGYDKVSVLNMQTCMRTYNTSRQYPGSIFKVPMLTQWMILVSGPRLIEDIRQASDDQLSLVDAAVEVIFRTYACHSILTYTHTTQDGS